VSNLSRIQDRNSILRKLGEYIRESVSRRDTGHPVFRGCIDWHSSVHGHWALFRIERSTGAAGEAARFAEASLETKGIEREMENLHDDPRFEMPYGRAWFLRLALEREGWARERGVSNPEALRAPARRTAGSLLCHYERHPPSPETAEYASDSWALAQLHDWFRHTGDEAGLETVRGHVKARFLGAEPRLTFEDDFSRPEFFSRFGNWVYLVAKTRDSAELARFLEDHPFPFDSVTPVRPLLGPPHHLGMNWCRAWALRALSRAVEDRGDRSAIEAAFDEHVEVGLELHDEHSADYHAYGHWVPQFAVYALTEGE